MPAAARLGEVSLWKVNTLRIGVTLLLLLSGAIVNAQSRPPGDDGVISLPQALAATMARNPELVAFGHQFEAQDGRILQAGLAPNPELSVMVENALGTGEFSGTDNAETTVSIAWVLERGVRQRRVDTARQRQPDRRLHGPRPVSVRLRARGGRLELKARIEDELADYAARERFGPMSRTCAASRRCASSSGWPRPPAWWPWLPPGV